MLFRGRHGEERDRRDTVYLLTFVFVGIGTVSCRCFEPQLTLFYGGNQIVSSYIPT